MSTAKTKINRQIVDDLLEKRGIDLKSVEMIEGGELSQAYAFRVRTGDRILRVNAGTDEGFCKDRYAAEHFDSYQRMKIGQW